MAGQLLELKRNYVKPVVVYLMPGSVSGLVRKQLTEEGMPVFHDLRIAVQSMASCSTGKAQEPETERMPAEVKQACKNALDLAAGRPTEFHLANYFRSYGITYPSMALADSEDAAVGAARMMGFPVVLKISSSRLLHKTRANLVYLPLADDDEVRDAFQQCHAAAAALEAWEDEVLVMSFLKYNSRIELLLGARIDAEFGPVLVFGLGGTWTESLSVAGVSPLAHTQSQAQAVVSCNKTVMNLLPAPDDPARKDLLDVILNFSRAAGYALAEFRELEINPLVMTDSKCYALDAAAIAGER